MEKYSHPIIEEVMRDSANKKCFDCGASYPKWASINNSVFVCLHCAGAHRGLGVNISFVKSLTMDNWDVKHLKFLKVGGNKRLRSLLEEFNIPGNTDIELKYKLNAVEYYRQMLRAELSGENFPEKPDLITGLERIDDGVKKDREIDNSNYISSEPLNANANKKQNSFFGKMGNFFEKKATELGSKIKEMKIGEKSKVFMDKTANYIDKTGKDLMKTQIMQKIVDKTKTVFVSKKKKEDVRETNDSENDKNSYPFNGNNNYNVNNYYNNSSNIPDINEVFQESENKTPYPNHQSDHLNNNQINKDQDINNFFGNHNQNNMNVNNANPNQHSNPTYESIFENNKQETGINSHPHANVNVNASVNYPSLLDLDFNSGNSQTINNQAKNNTNLIDY